MRRIRGVVVIAAALSLFAVAGCGGYGGGSDDSEEGAATTIAGMATESHGTKDVSDESGKVEIELYDNYFEPTNEGKAAHTFTISKQSVDKEIQPGDETETEVTFPQSGQLEFVCTFHQSSGMVGLLETSGSSSTSTSTESSKY